MKVLILTAHCTPYIGGGAEIIIQEHITTLKKFGVEVSILCIGSEAGLIKDETEGVRVYRAGIRNMYFHHGKTRQSWWRRGMWHLLDIYNPLMKEYIRQVIEIEKPDVASCHILAGWSIAAWDVLHEMGIPIVQVLHDQYLLCPRSIMFNGKEPCSRQCFKCRMMRILHPSHSNKVTAVVGVSRFILDKLLSNGYFRDTPIKDFTHNTRKFDPPETSIEEKDNDKIVFGFIGNLAGHKGIELLLETFIRHAQPNWRLKVAGRGHEEYETKLKERYSHPQLEFVGYVGHRSFFPTLDVTVVPSLCEDTFPGVVFESLQYGVPVIGSNRGGIPDIIVEDRSGMLFDPATPHALADAMAAMASNIGFYRSMKGQIQQDAAVFGDQDAWAKKWIEVYDRTIKLQPPFPSP